MSENPRSINVILQISVRIGPVYFSFEPSILIDEAVNAKYLNKN